MCVPISAFLYQHVMTYNTPGKNPASIQPRKNRMASIPS